MATYGGAPVRATARLGRARVGHGRLSREHQFPGDGVPTVPGRGRDYGQRRKARRAMATTTELSRNLDSSLCAIAAEADLLPELASDRDPENPYTRADRENEWDVLFMRLGDLDDARHAGERTVAQRARYQALRAKLRDLLPAPPAAAGYPARSLSC